MNDSNKKYNRGELEQLLDNESGTDKRELLALWDSLSDHKPSADYDSDMEQAVLGRILNEAQSSSRAQGRLRLVSMRYAAAACVAFAVCAAWYLLVPVTIHVEPGDVAEIVLPDGSDVELNSGTAISYRRHFFGGRNVSLDGEGFFDVQKMEVPFSVKTFNASVDVLGTSFNVKAWENSYEPSTVVTLITGSVALESTSGLEKVMMAPGQTKSVLGGSIQSDDQAPAAASVAWQHGDLIYTDKPLAVILEDVQRRFNRSILLSVPELYSRNVSIALRDPESAEAVVRDICGAYSLHYREVSGGFEIFQQ